MGAALWRIECGISHAVSKESLEAVLAVSMAIFACRPEAVCFVFAFEASVAGNARNWRYWWRWVDGGSLARLTIGCLLAMAVCSAHTLLRIPPSGLLVLETLALISKRCLLCNSISDSSVPVPSISA